jgi:hypothetical protein
MVSLQVKERTCNLLARQGGSHSAWGASGQDRDQVPGTVQAPAEGATGWAGETV